MKAFALLIACTLLGCASNPQASSPQPIMQTAVQCIPIRTWTKAEQKKLASALKPLPEKSIVLTLERDWQKMRDAARACGGK